MKTIAQRREHERSKYLRLVKHRPKYGSTNHGSGYAHIIRAWKPYYLVDFGCGGNEFAVSMRGEHAFAVGVDFANPAADINAPMHATGLRPGVADVVTSFDAMEHLIEEDVDPVLDEMVRVAKRHARFVFSISTRPSNIKVDGENLHPTVRPMEWWLEKIKRVASDVDLDHGYVVGSFA